MRAVPHHRSSGDARAERRHLHGDSLPPQGDGGKEGPHRHRGEQTRCGGSPAGDLPKRLERVGGGAAGEVPAGGREDVVRCAPRSGGALRRTASGCPRFVLQRGHHGRDRSPPASRSRHSGTGHHRDGACREEKGQLPHPHRHPAALPARARRRRGGREPRLPRWADDGGGSLEPGHLDHQGHVGGHCLYGLGGGANPQPRLPLHPMQLLCRCLPDLPRSISSGKAGSQRRVRDHGGRAQPHGLLRVRLLLVCLPVAHSLVQQFRAAKAAVRKAKAGAA